MIKLPAYPEYSALVQNKILIITVFVGAALAAVHSIIN